MFNSDEDIVKKTGVSLDGRVGTEFRAHRLQPCNFTSGKNGNPEKQNGDTGKLTQSPLFPYT